MLDANLIEVQELLEIYWSKNIYNVLVFINMYEETLLLTFELFDSTENCGKVSVKVINNFQNGKFINKIGSWKKFQNMNQCPVTVTTYTDSIAVFKQILPNGSSALRGYEYEMIQYIANMLNFTLDLVYKEGKQEWGVVYENGSCTRGFEDLKNRNTDILLGDLYLKELRAKYFDPSAPYLNYPLFFILSKQPRLNMFQKMLSPFQSTVWILIAVTLCIGISAILMINFKFKLIKLIVFGENVIHPVTNLYTSFFGQPQTRLPHRNFARILLMTFLIFSLVIRSAYQAKTNVDIVKDSHPKMYDASYIMEENDEVDLDVALKWFKRTASFASKTTLMNYSLANDNFPYKICKEQFLTFNIVLFYNKNFFLKLAIDEAIQKISMHGFMNHWMKKYDKTDKWRFIDRKPSVMTFDHLSGSFSLLLIGCVLSTFVFVFELIF
ncbi:hypothetical protein ACKWTF_008997 [Chironomus riparius]